MDLFDENRYSRRRAGNRFLSALWSFILTIIVIVVAIIIFVASLPWLKALWETIT